MFTATKHEPEYIGNAIECDFAIFGSAKTSRFSGYQLIHRSSGISDATAREISNWCPSHNGIRGTEKAAESFNLFPIAFNQFVVSRTFYGGPEYSMRGGLNVLTLMLVFDSGDLDDSLDCHSPVEILRSALMQGHLRLDKETSNFRKEFFLHVSPWFDSSNAIPSELVDEILGFVVNGEPVVLVTKLDKLKLLKQLFDHAHFMGLPSVSVTTGLKMSSKRPFQVQIYSEKDDAMLRQIHRNGHQLIDLET